MISLSDWLTSIRTLERHICRWLVQFVLLAFEQSTTASLMNLAQLNETVDWFVACRVVFTQARWLHEQMMDDGTSRFPDLKMQIEIFFQIHLYTSSSKARPQNTSSHSSAWLESNVPTPGWRLVKASQVLPLVLPLVLPSPRSFYSMNCFFGQSIQETLVFTSKNDGGSNGFPVDFP